MSYVVQDSARMHLEDRENVPSFATVHIRLPSGSQNLSKKEFFLQVCVSFRASLLQLGTAKPGNDLLE